MNAFAALLADRPASRITVTALAAEADMNKSTFYLHYPHVRALADSYAAQVADELVGALGCSGILSAYFTDPLTFVSGLVDHIDTPRGRGHARELTANGLLEPFLSRLVSRMVEEVVTLPGGQEVSPVLVRFMLSGLFDAVLRHLDQREDPGFREEIGQAFARLLAP